MNMILRSCKSGTAKMRPRARLISLIGEQLISDEPVALVELVKNAYDADATCVEISFQGKNPERPDTIIVSDDGVGMNLETFLKGWFEPGTVLKHESSISPGGRKYQGAKGIGRFAAARLARSLILESKMDTVEEGIFLMLDWGKFDEESFLDEISIDYEVRPLSDLKHGTRLILEGLRKTWTPEDYEELYSRLSRLVSPFGEVVDFKIFLEIPGCPQFSGEVQPPALILQPKYLLRGTLDEKGTFSGNFLVDGHLMNKFLNHKLGGKDAIPICGPFQVEIRAWDRDRPGLEPLMERYSMSIQEIRRTLNNYCGVSIYRDGFRVYPYGQKGNDWLNLDIRSRQNPPRNLANNQIVAAIRISRENNPGLEDRSTREGMILNEEHAALGKWFIEILSLLEDGRYKLRPRRDSTEQVEPLFEAFDISSVVQHAQKELGKKHPVAVVITETEKQIKEGVERIQEVFSRLLMSAGLGHMVDIVIHEIGSPLGKINRQLAIMENRLGTVLQKEYKKQFLPMINSIKGWLEQIYNLRQRLDPQTPAKRGRASTFDVLEEINDDFELYKALIQKQGITYKISYTKRPIIVKMSRASLSQILVNLIDNSIFWLIRDKGVGSGGRIHVFVEPLEEGFRLLFSDDGPGVSEEDRLRIFEPYFTRKPNGMGLGLYISRLLIEPYGKLLYRDDCELSGACFEARFERSVGL